MLLRCVVCRDRPTSLNCGTKPQNSNTTGGNNRTTNPLLPSTIGKLNYTHRHYVYIYTLYICIVIILSFCRVAASSFGRSLKEFSSAQSSRSNSPTSVVSVNIMPTTLWQHCSIFSWAIKPINQPAGFICLPYLVAVFSPLRLSPCRLSFLLCFAYCFYLLLSLFHCLCLWLSLSLSLCNLSSCKQNAHPFVSVGSVRFFFFVFFLYFLSLSQFSTNFTIDSCAKNAKQ